MPAAKFLRGGVACGALILGAFTPDGPPHAQQTQVVLLGTDNPPQIPTVPARLQPSS